MGAHQSGNGLHQVQTLLLILINNNPFNNLGWFAFFIETGLLGPVTMAIPTVVGVSGNRSFCRIFFCFRIGGNRHFFQLYEIFFIVQCLLTVVGCFAYTVLRTAPDIIHTVEFVHKGHLQGAVGAVSLGTGNGNDSKMIRFFQAVGTATP